MSLNFILWVSNNYVLPSPPNDVYQPLYVTKESDIGEEAELRLSIHRGYFDCTGEGCQITVITKDVSTSLTATCMYLIYCDVLEFTLPVQLKKAMEKYPEMSIEVVVAERKVFLASFSSRGQIREIP